MSEPLYEKEAKLYIVCAVNRDDWESHRAIEKLADHFQCRRGGPVITS